MEKRTELIGPFEQLVLTAILALGDEAYGLAIHERVGVLANKTVRQSAIYMTLERMEEKEYIESWETAGTPERGGRSRRCYKLRALGEQVLHDSAETAKRVYETVNQSL
jgi:DNA-binding PadR family transcriptional regulator